MVRRGIATEGYVGGIAPGHTIKAQGLVVYPTLPALDGLDRHTPLGGDWTGRETAAQPERMAIRSGLDSGSRLVARGGFSRSLSNSSAIGGFLICGGIPLRVLLWVILCRSGVA